MLKLQRAKTVACGLLRWDRCCIIVVSHWSKPAGQNMASLLVVVGFRTSHSMPKEESHVIFSKNLPLKAPPPSTIALPEAFGAACPGRARPLSALRPCAPAGLSHRAGGAAIAAGEGWSAAGALGGSRGCARGGPAQKCRLHFLSAGLVDRKSVV